MSNTQWSDLSRSQQAREDFYQSGPPLDPIAMHKEHGGAHYNRALGTTLMPTSHMSVGEHMGKTMTAVPPEYFAWVNNQKWAKYWHQWQPVADYLDRHPVSSLYLKFIPANVIVVSPGGRLSCPPKHEDKLHAFVAGALRLQRFQFTEKRRLIPPSYFLSAAHHAAAFRHGAHPLNPHELGVFLSSWEENLKACTRHCYGTEAEAAAEAARLNPRRQREHKPLLRAVYCDPCALWHITSTQAPDSDSAQ